MPTIVYATLSFKTRLFLKLRTLIAAGHLPIAFVLLPEAGLTVVLFVISANSAFGLIAGYLYWKKGLESAMIAHMFAHLVLVAATYAGAYF